MTLVVENNNPARDLLFFTAGVSAGGVLAAAFSRCSS
jgi:hypothetical protein